MRPLAAALLASALAAGAAPQDPSYAVTRLALDRADAILAYDIDGDKRPDLVVQSGLDLHFFLLRNGAFRESPDITLRLESGTFLWTLAKFCDGDLPCVATMSSRGIHRHPRADGGFAPRPQDLVIHPNIFEGSLAPTKAPLHLDFMPDLDVDGLPDALLFARGEVLVLRQRADAGRPDFRLSQKLEVPIDAGLVMLFGPHQQVHEVTSVPVIAVGDLNGDKRPDISWYQNDSMGAYYQQPDGRFTHDDPRTIVENRKRRSSYLKFEVPPQIVDLNNDGLLDVVVVLASKGRTIVYLNRDGKLDFINPDALLAVDKSWSAGAYLKDLDRDGRMEIVSSIVRKLNIVSGIDAFISKKIDLELHVYRYDEQRKTYLNTPAQQLTFTIPYTFTATRESANIDLIFRPCFDADVDGDGRLDLLVDRDGRSLSVFRGAKDRLIEEKASAAISFDPPANVASTQPFVADFNGDGRSDLVLRYALADKKHAVDVLMSGK